MYEREGCVLCANVRFVYYVRTRELCIMCEREGCVLRVNVRVVHYVPT